MVLCSGATVATWYQWQGLLPTLRNTVSNTGCIPADILFSILVRIPPISLQKLKLVSKEWYRIISDPYFAEAHLDHQSQMEFGWGVFINTTKGLFFWQGTSSSTPNPPKPVKLPGTLGPHVLGSCKGLVLFSSFEESYKLHVANPVTGESFIIPPFYGYNDDKNKLKSAGIGFGSSGEVKVVVIVTQLHHTPTTSFICGILTLGSSSWSEMLTPVLKRHLKIPIFHSVFAGGALHWCYDMRILSLDLSQEKFHQTDVTFCSANELKKNSFPIQWDGCYCVMFPRRKPSPFYTQWVLRDFGWARQPDIDSAFFESLGFSGGDDRPKMLTTVRNGELILFRQSIGNETLILVYDLDRRVMTKFAQFDHSEFLNFRRNGRCCVIAHVNSIISWQTNGVLKKRTGIWDAMVFNSYNILANAACTIRNLFRQCHAYRCRIS